VLRNGLLWRLLRQGEAGVRTRSIRALGGRAGFVEPQRSPAMFRCSLDSQHKLVNLQGVPIAIVTSEASFLGLGDADTVAFLQRGGCEFEHVCLADHGVRGNGH
jgi:hypothetical protein